MAKVIHVHLTRPVARTKQRDWYFGSISAVYSVFTPEEVGATRGYLLHAGLSGNGTVVTNGVRTQIYRLSRGVVGYGLMTPLCHVRKYAKIGVFQVWGYGRGYNLGLQFGVTFAKVRGYKFGILKGE